MVECASRATASTSLPVPAMVRSSEWYSAADSWCSGPPGLERLEYGEQFTTGERKLLILSELNFLLAWRDKDGVEDFSGEALKRQYDNKHTMFIRPGADRLIASLLRESRCCLVFATCVSHWYSLWMALELIRWSVPGRWEVENAEEEGQMPAVVYKGHSGVPGVTRIYVASGEHHARAPPVWSANRLEENEHANRLRKNIDDIYDCLAKSGEKWFNRIAAHSGDMTVILDTSKDSSTQENNVIVVPKWKATKYENKWWFDDIINKEEDWNTLREYLFDLVEDSTSKGTTVQSYLSDRPCPAWPDHNGLSKAVKFVETTSSDFDAVRRHGASSSQGSQGEDICEKTM